ncbi:MAG: hypothetical protein ACRDYE_01435 [Acidimicrobiales bacterium]
MIGRRAEAADWSADVIRVRTGVAAVAMERRTGSRGVLLSQGTRRR